MEAWDGMKCAKGTPMKEMRRKEKQGGAGGRGREAIPGDWIFSVVKLKLNTYCTVLCEDQIPLNGEHRQAYRDGGKSRKNKKMKYVCNDSFAFENPMLSGTHERATQCAVWMGRREGFTRMRRKKCKPFPGGLDSIPRIVGSVLHQSPKRSSLSIV